MIEKKEGKNLYLCFLW